MYASGHFAVFAELSGAQGRSAALGALFQVLAAFTVIAFARTVFSERSRDPRALGLAAVGIVVTAVFTG